MAKKSKKSRIIVITGGSSGIGAQLVRRFMQNGDAVVTLSRTNPDEFLPLDETGAAAGQARFLACDLSDSAQTEAAAARLTECLAKIDILINNAGLGISGATELLPVTEVRGVVEVDYFAALLLSSRLLPLVCENGKIVTISSACALFALPFRGVYCAAKAAASMLSYSMRMELSNTSIKAVCICPGDIKSGFTANRRKVAATNARYGNRVTNAAKKIDSREHKRMDADRSGKAIYKICDKKRGALYIVGAKYKFLYAASRLLPVGLFLKLTDRMFGGK